MNGRIIATLKRISHDFSLKDFLNAKPVQDASVLIGEWVYVNPDSTPSSVIEVQADDSFLKHSLKTILSLPEPSKQKTANMPSMTARIICICGLHPIL